MRAINGYCTGIFDYMSTKWKHEITRKLSFLWDLYVCDVLILNCTFFQQTLKFFKKHFVCKDGVGEARLQYPLHLITNKNKHKRSENQFRHYQHQLKRKINVWRRWVAPNNDTNFKNCWSKEQTEGCDTVWHQSSSLFYCF